MKGNAVNMGKICLKETYNDKSIVFGGRAKGGTVEVEHPNDDAGIALKKTHKLPSLSAYFTRRLSFP